MKKLFVLLTVLSTVVFISCEKDETDSVNILSDTEKAVITNDAAVDNVAEAADYEVDYFTGSSTAITGISGTKGYFPPRPRYVDGVGPAVTVDPVGDVWPKTITIDYGQGVELVNGRILSGQIIIVVSAPPLTNGATREITYQNFYVDSTNVAGGGVCTFTGTDTTQRVFATNSDLTFTFSDESVLYRHGEHTRTLADGFETVYDHSDDLILITGFVNYTTEDDLTFSKTIIEPLTKTGECRYIVEGVVEFTLDDEVFAILDYGDGTCDDIATITKDGETIQITINRRRGFPQHH
ncbi:MAG: hypothetical protein C0599_02310 [Salinivirgaceae bacterium]|nr:MAG: hypothetical protein C0599_02310 [Salinivirgaceae bacterium]